jgi:predicted nuclease of predicted toxin-antitoxin system
MRRFLIDANLPTGLPTWKKESFLFVAEIDPEWSDSEIWSYARKNDCTIVTKDADFSNRIIIVHPPPRVIHFRIGNMRLRELITFIDKKWPSIERASKSHKLVNVYLDRIESVA